MPWAIRLGASTASDAWSLSCRVRIAEQPGKQEGQISGNGETAESERGCSGGR